jgi:hypothetical protein
MSDTPQGQGWRLASDGKWYSAESAPAVSPSPPPPEGAPVDPEPRRAAPPPWSAATLPRGSAPVPHPPPASGLRPTVARAPIKKRLYQRAWFWVVIVLLAGIGGYAVTRGGGGAPANNATVPTHTIVYSVTGSGTPTVSSITYAVVGNSQVAVSTAPIPWSKTIKAQNPPATLSLTVRNGSIGLSYVTCTITEDGELLITNTSKGPFNIATCDAAGTS